MDDPIYDAEPDTRLSIDPQNLRAELVRQFTTVVRYSLRHGLTTPELHSIVESALAPTAEGQLSLIAPSGYVFVKVPDLLKIGVSDMRDAK